MMITIHGLPVSAKYQEVKVLIRQVCNVNEFILDNIVADIDGQKKVKVGVMNEADGEIVLNCLNGYRMGGNNLRAVPIGKPEYQQPSQNFDNRGLPLQNSLSNNFNQPREQTWGQAPGQWQGNSGAQPGHNFNYRPQGPNNQYGVQPLTQRDGAGFGQQLYPSHAPQQGPSYPPANKVRPYVDARAHNLRSVELINEPMNRPLVQDRMPLDNQGFIQKPHTIMKDNFQGPQYIHGQPPQTQVSFQNQSSTVLPWGQPQPQPVVFPKPNPQPIPKFSPAGRPVSPRRFSPGRGSPRRYSPGRKGSPRRYSPGRKGSPGRRMSPDRRFSPSGRRHSPLRRGSPGDIRGRRSHGRSVSPDRRRRISPDRRSPGRRGSPRRDTHRFSPARKTKADDGRPTFGASKASNQDIYSGGYRAGAKENVQFPPRRGNEEPVWQKARIKKPDDDKKDISRDAKFGLNFEAPSRRSRSPNRRDRSPIKDRFKKHSPSPRSPRRSWALEKRNSPKPSRLEPPPPPTWPGQSETFTRDHHKADTKGPVWEGPINIKEEKISDRQFDERKNFRDGPRDSSPRRLRRSPDRFERDPPPRRYSPDRPNFRDMPPRSDLPPRSEPVGRKEAKKVFMYKSEEFKKDLEDIYKRAQEFKKKTEELNKKRQSEDRYGMDDRRRDERDDDRRDYRRFDVEPASVRERPTFEEDLQSRDEHTRKEDSRHREPEWLPRINVTLDKGAKEKRDKANEDISRKILSQRLDETLKGDIKSRIMEDMKRCVMRILNDMFENKDVSYIEMIIKFDAKYDMAKQDKIFDEVMSNYPKHFRKLKRSASDIPETVTKSARIVHQSDMNQDLMPTIASNAAARPYKPGYVKKPTFYATPYARNYNPSLQSGNNADFSGQYAYHQPRPVYSADHTVQHTSSAYHEQSSYNPKGWRDYHSKPAVTDNYVSDKYRDEDHNQQFDHKRNSWTHHQPEPASTENYGSATTQSDAVEQRNTWHDQSENTINVFCAPLNLKNETGEKRNTPNAVAVIPNKNMHYPIFVKIHFTAKPVKEDLAQFLRKYRICKFKRIQATNTFAAQLKSLDDYDRICGSDDVRCGPHRVNIKPSHKLAARAERLRVAVAEKQHDQLKNKTENKQVDVKKVDNSKQTVPVTEASYNTKPSVNANISATIKSDSEKPHPKKSVEHNKVSKEPNQPKPTNKPAAVTENKQPQKVSTKVNEQKPNENVTKTPVSTNKSVVNQSATKINQQTPKLNVASKPALNVSGTQNDKMQSKSDINTKSESQVNLSQVSKNNTPKNQAVKTAQSVAVTTKSATSQIVKSENVGKKDKITPATVNVSKVATLKQVIEPKQIVNTSQIKPNVNKNQTPAKTGPTNTGGSLANVKKTEKVEAKNISQVNPNANKNQSPNKVVTIMPSNLQTKQPNNNQIVKQTQIASSNAKSSPAVTKKTEKVEDKNICQSQPNANKTQSPAKVETNIPSNLQTNPEVNENQTSPKVEVAPKTAKSCLANANKTEEVEAKNICDAKLNVNKNQSPVKVGTNIPSNSQTNSGVKMHQTVTKAEIAPKNVKSGPAEAKNITETKRNAGKNQSLKQETEPKNVAGTTVGKKTDKNEVKISQQSKPSDKQPNNNVNNKQVITKPTQINPKKISNVPAKNITAKVQGGLAKKQMTMKTNKKMQSKVSPRKSNKSAIKSTLDKYDDYDELTDQDILALISGGVILDECSGSDGE